jgi:uncharacterized phage-like protein YoqJ
MRIVGATGHRPKLLGGYHPHVQARLNKLAFTFLEREKPDKVVSGMALGWDTAIANMACQLRIPYIAAIPFPQQADVWPSSAKEIWEYLRERAEREIIIADEYSPEALKKRNFVICDESTEIAALWNGDLRSGTGHCITYARHNGMKITNLYDEYLILANQMLA